MVGPIIVSKWNRNSYIMFCEYVSGKEPALPSSKQNDGLITIKRNGSVKTLWKMFNFTSLMLNYKKWRKMSTKIRKICSRKNYTVYFS